MLGDLLGGGVHVLLEDREQLVLVGHEERGLRAHEVHRDAAQPAFGERELVGLLGGEAVGEPLELAELPEPTTEPAATMASATKKPP